VTAAYGGDSNYAPAVSGRQSFAVSHSKSKAGTVTSLSLSAPSITYGNEQALNFTVTVSAKTGAAPSGTVTVSTGAGKQVLCQVTLKNGEGRCSPSSTALQTGKYSIRAFYGGDRTFGRSKSAVSRLKVSK
jgi:hypothetical protein